MSTQPDLRGVQRAVESALHRHWVLFLIEGIVLLVLGAFAVLVPPVATLAVTILFGWLLRWRSRQLYETFNSPSWNHLKNGALL